MGIFDYEYLSPTQLKGFNTYKYCSIDNSPISVYFSHPFWNFVVEFYPRWLAPNVLTLGGWILVMGCFVLESYLDYGLTRNSVGTTDPLPHWFWPLAAICTFAAHTMDGTDGKQSRRIGATGPVGELFDHGLDSWSTVPFTITIFSVFGQGEFSISCFRLLCVLISVQVVFIVTHWEKYNTGVLFLSWAYDASQYGLCLVYLWTYLVGFEWYRFYVTPSITFAVAFESGFYLCCLGSLITSFYNMYDAKVKGTFQQPNLTEAIRPILSSVFLFFISTYWAWNSPNSVVSLDPRAFFFCMGTVFSNIACRLIIAQMSSTRADVGNRCLYMYSLVAFLSLYIVPSAELIILRATTLVILAAHVHYGVCIVRQLCSHFKIHALDVSYLQHKQ